MRFRLAHPVAGVSESHDPLAVDDPVGQRLHGRLLRAVEIGLILVNAATGHAGFRRLSPPRRVRSDPSALEPDPGRNRREGGMNRAPYRARRSSGTIAPHSPLDQLAGQTQAIPGHVRAIVGFMVENDENLHDLPLNGNGSSAAGEAKMRRATIRKIGQFNRLESGVTPLHALALSFLRPAAFHSLTPSSVFLTRKPCAPSRATASSDSTQNGPRQ